MVLVNVSVRDGIAGGKTAWHGDEIRLQKDTIRLLFDEANDIGIRHALHGIVPGVLKPGVLKSVASGVECGLNIDALNRRVIEAETDDLPDLVFIDAALDGGDQDYGAIDFRETVERAKLGGQNTRLAPDNLPGPAFETVELKVDIRPQFGQFGEKAVVGGDPFTVRVPSITLGIPRCWAAWDVRERFDG